MLEVVLICFVFGCFSGLLAGLFGIGGGLVLVPFFIALLEWQGVASHLVMLMAVATSLATIIVTSIAATRTQHSLGAVIWSYVFNLSIGLLLGVLLGAFVADIVLSEKLRFVFAVYMLYVAVQMAMQYQPKLDKKKRAGFGLKVSGLWIGFVSAILGIGGGSLIVPLLAKRDTPMRNAIAVSSACGLPIAVVGTISYVLLGWEREGLPEGSVGYVYVPAFAGVVVSSMLSAPFGAKLANRLPAKQLKRYFSILLFIIAAKLLWRFMY